jgi:hypothetical protein
MLFSGQIEYKRSLKSHLYHCGRDRDIFQFQRRQILVALLVPIGVNRAGFAGGSNS